VNRLQEPEKNHPGRRRMKVFGERNTATRAVSMMLQNLKSVTLAVPRKDFPDLDAIEEKVFQYPNHMRKALWLDALNGERFSRLGAVSDWKHAAPRIDDSYQQVGASVIFLVRNPYSWIWSFSQRRYHSRTPWHPDFRAFIDQPWMCLKQDNVGPFVTSPMHLWNKKLLCYQRFKESNCAPNVVVRFEEFVQEPVETLCEALNTFEIPSEDLVALREGTKTGKTGGEIRTDFFRSEGWRKYFSRSTVELVNDTVDWNVAQMFGYEKLDPKDFPAEPECEIVDKIASDRPYSKWEKPIV